jgi:translation initiation factor IF-2
LAKIRVNKLALELNIQNDQIIEALQKNDVAVKNHMSSIDEEATQYIRELFTPKTAAAATSTKKVVKKAKAKIKIKVPSKVTVTTAKTQAKSTAAKKAEKPNEKSAKNLKTKTKAKAETAKKTKSTEKIKGAPESKTGKKLGLKIVKKEDKPKPAEEKPAPVKKEKPTPTIKEKSVAIPTPPVTPKPAPEIVVPEESFEVVQIGENTPVRELAEKLKCTPNDVIKELMVFGILANINQALNFDIASKVADKLGFEVELHIEKSELDFSEEEEDNSKDHVAGLPL